jgi:hypothetical protein
MSVEVDFGGRLCSTVNLPAVGQRTLRRDSIASKMQVEIHSATLRSPTHECQKQAYAEQCAAIRLRNHDVVSQAHLFGT